METNIKTIFPSADLETRLTEILCHIGVPTHIKGYQYLRTAILMAVEDIYIFDFVTNVLYPAVARNHATTASIVARAIRHAIKVTWDGGDADSLNRFFIYNKNRYKIPTTSVFISSIAAELR